MASAAAASSNYASASSNYPTTSDDRSMPKFSQYRSRLMLGDLPPDFLRVQITSASMYPPQGWGVPHAQAQGHAPAQYNPNFLGYFTLTIAEARLVKSSGLLGLMKMDPYVTFRIGHVHYETPTATGGGKNPQWKASYRINLFKGMDTIHLEVYDQRNFTEDSFIGECDINIPSEVMQGETRQHWYPLLARQPSGNDNQGDILVIMSFMPVTQIAASASTESHDAPMRPPTQSASANAASANTDASKQRAMSGAGPAAAAATASASTTAAAASGASSSPTHQLREQYPAGQYSPSVIPKPPPPPYTEEDVRNIQEMFPKTDRRTIIDLLDRNGGNQDLVVNQLLQDAL